MWIPNMYSRCVRRMVWLIVSKAAESSRSVTNDTFLKSEERSVIYNMKENGISAMVGAVGRLERMKEVVT